MSSINIQAVRIAYVFEIPEPYHVATLEEKLAKNNYNVSHNRIFRQGPIEAILLQIAMKDNAFVNYESDRSPSFIGIESNTVQKSLKYFHELTDILDEIESNKKQQAVIEGSIISHVFTKNQPRAKLSYLGRCISDRFNGIIKDVNPQLSECTLFWKQNEKIFTINIAPLYNMQKYYYMRLTFRSQSQEEIEKFLNDGYTNIEGYLKGIEHE